MYVWKAFQLAAGQVEAMDYGGKKTLESGSKGRTVGHVMSCLPNCFLMAVDTSLWTPAMR